MTARAPIATPVFASPTRMENERVWTRLWTCVGLEQQLPGIGDVLPATIGDYGLHVQRDEGGHLRAGFNIMQHGSCQIIPEQCRSGHKTTCAYTACAFSRDSDTISADDGHTADAARQFIGFNPLKMRYVAVELVGPLVFVTLAGRERTNLRQQLGPTGSAIDELELDRRSYGGRFWVDVPCHWSQVGGAIVRALGGGSPSGAVTRLTPAGDLNLFGADGRDGQVRVWQGLPNVLVVAAPEHVAVVVIKPIAAVGASLVVSLFSTGSAAITSHGSEGMDRWKRLMAVTRAEAMAKDLAEPAPLVAALTASSSDD